MSMVDLHEYQDYFFQQVVANTTSQVNDIDVSAMKMLKKLVSHCKTKEVSLCLSGCKGPVRDFLETCGLSEQIGDENMYVSVHQAVLRISQHPDQQYDEEAMQENYQIEVTPSKAVVKAKRAEIKGKVALLP